MNRANALLRPVSILALSFASLAVAPRIAHAGLSACGNIDVSATANCSLVTTPSECTTKCAPASFEECCAAKLEQQCNAQCTATASESCTSSCTTDCTTTCTPNPGSVDCTTDCSDRCKAGCTSSCTTSGNTTDCESSCGACCNDHCDTKCVTVPPSDDCSTKCNASCTASCTAEANTACQVQCQSSSYTQCKDEFNKTCTTQCTQPEGALFCDGSYVDVGDNLANCVEALNGVLKTKIVISVTASGSTTCSGNDCTSKGTSNTKVSCAASSAPAPGGPLAAFGAVFAMAIAAARRRSSKR